jgi:hypothetical protein
MIYSCTYYSFFNIIRRARQADEIIDMGSVYKSVVGNNWERPLGRLDVDDIKYLPGAKHNAV